MAAEPRRRMDAFMIDLLEKLNPPQRDAVQHIEGPLLILAGPGSGKTRVITHRIAWMLQHGIPARQILALTFTNKAADEMRARLARLAPGHAVWMGTFHRFGARQLRRLANLVGLRDNYSIFDSSDSLRLLKRVLSDLPSPPEFATPESIAHEISWAKNQFILPDQYKPHRSSALGGIVQQVYPLYQQRLLDCNAADFDDLLLHFARLLRENPELRADLDERFRYLMVDEYQDTNLVQYAIVRGLSINHPNLAVTGDPDQSIYGWRGANIQNILSFEQDYPDVTVVRLEQNYRSTQHIVRAAAVLIGHNRRRKEKTLFTENEAGSPIKLVIYENHEQEATQIVRKILEDVQGNKHKLRDFAIFYRTNALSRIFENVFREYGVPYQIVGGMSFYERQEIKDVLAYLHLLNNPQHDEAMERVINVPPRGIGGTTLKRLREHAARNRMSLLSAAREVKMIESIKARGAGQVLGFVQLYDQLSAIATGSIEDILGHLLILSGYRDKLIQSENPEDEDRLANLEELLTDAREFDRLHPQGSSLQEFLERTSLVSDLDTLDGERDHVTLMTMHSAKGLEYPVVFVVACEQGILPHERSRHDGEELEEERRLMFVAMTRAERELQLSIAKVREFRGQRRYSVPSEFLQELPREEMDLQEIRLGFAAPSRSLDPNPYNEFHDDAPEEPVFRRDASPDEYRVAPAPSQPPRRERPNSALPLTTAAGLLAAKQGAGTENATDRFALGMVVQHPQHGMGIVTSLSGDDDKRIASVRFLEDKDGRERKFRLAFSELTPVKGK